MAEQIATAQRASTSDVPAISCLVEEYAGPGYLLPRRPKEIERTIGSWFIVQLGNELLACGSLLPYSESLAEIRSMAVAPGHSGQGHGSAVLTALIEEGRRRGYQTLFALTRAVPFFENHGFSVSHHLHFPEKVWRDCLACPFIDDCDETAVVLDLSQAGEEPYRFPLTAKKGEYYAEQRS